MSGELVVAVADFLAHKRALGRKYRAEVRHSAIPFGFTSHLQWEAIRSIRDHRHIYSSALTASKLRATS